MRAAFLDGDTALFSAAIVEIVKIDHFANFDEAETDVLGTHDPCKPRTVSLGIDAGQAHARRRDQALVLVKAKRAGGAVKFRREIRDRKLFALELEIGRAHV